MRVLVVEDNALLRHHLKVQLQELGHQVDAAEDAREADYYLGEHLPDIAIVDLGLPDEDGLSLIRRWRSHDVSLPVLVLTAREGWQDKVEVLSAGADDYVTKPFRLAELLARVRALLRRGGGEVADGDLVVQDVRIDVAAHRAYVAGKELSLTAKEFELLRVLVREAGNVVPRDTLMREVWGNGLSGSTKTLDMHVSWLRRKLGDDAASPRYITTVRGMGFRFEKPSA